jgi:hypothetical protein
VDWAFLRGAILARADPGSGVLPGGGRMWCLKNWSIRVAHMKHLKGKRKMDKRDDRSHLAPESGTGSFNAAASRQFACAEARHRVRMCRGPPRVWSGKRVRGCQTTQSQEKCSPQLSAAAAVKDGPAQHV